ncbi:MAG: hypothetical protein V4489_05200 [Chlamydiota bacterium]
MFRIGFGEIHAKTRQSAESIDQLSQDQVKIQKIFIEAQNLEREIRVT